MLYGYNRSSPVAVNLFLSYLCKEVFYGITYSISSSVKLFIILSYLSKEVCYKL